MDRTADDFQKSKVRSNADLADNSGLESAGFSLQPPAFQLKAGDESSEQESRSFQGSKESYQFEAYPNTHNVNPNAKDHNTGLPTQLKSGIESLSGMSMDDVRVHYNSSQPAQLKAHAFAKGSHIHVGPGQEKHLGHEAWHVVQQKQGRVKPTVQMYGRVNVNDDQSLETEADVMGDKAMQLKTWTEMGNNFVHPENTPVFQLEGDEEGKESWGSWLWKHKYKLAIGAGLTLGAAYALYNSSGGQTPDVPAPSVAGEAASNAAEVASSTASSAASDAAEVASSTASDAASGGSEVAESIWAMSFRQSISGPQPGDAAPPCPLDPVTGGPNMDAWGDLIEKAVKPLFEKGSE